MEKFKVVLVGTRPGADQAMVVRNLSQLFKTDPGRIETMFKKPQTVIKTGLTREAAEKYKAALEKAGASAKVISAAPAAPSATPEPAPMRLEREKEIERPTPKATCPGCGYEAMDSDDPLITAHGGEGECPKCGVVPKKVMRTQAADSFQGGDVKIIGAKSGSGIPGGPIARIALVAVVVLALAGGWYFLSRDTGSTTTARKPNAVDKARAVAKSATTASDEVEESSTGAQNQHYLIPPGQSQKFTLTGPVPYIHAPVGSARIEGEYGIVLDEWSEHGIPVDLYGSYIYSEQYQIWAAGSEVTNLQTQQVTTVFTPVMADGRLAQSSGDPRVVKPIRVSDPIKLTHLGNVAIDDLLKIWKKKPDLVVTGYEHQGYTFYFFTVTFTVTAPSEEELAAANDAASISRLTLGIGPTLLLFNDGDTQDVIVKDESTYQIPLSLSLYRNTGKIMGVYVDCYKQDYTLTAD